MELAGLTRNLSLKLLALLLALVVYAHVQTENEQESEFRVAMRLVGLPESLVLGGEAPRHASVRIRGTGKQLLKLKVQPPEVMVDLREARPGRIQRLLSATDVVMPVGTTAVVAEVLEPRMVEIPVDTLIHKTLPIDPVWKGRPATALAVAGPFELDPPWATVRGPSLILEARSSLATVPIDLEDLRGFEWRDVFLDLPPGVRTVHPTSVRVRAPMVPAANRVYVHLPVRAEGVPAGWIADFAPPTVEALIAGPEALLASTPAESIRVVARSEGLDLGRHLLTPEVQVPFEPQLRLVRLRPSRVTLRLGSPEPGGEKTGN